MRAVEYNNYGGPEVLQLTEVTKPVPKENQILIKIIASTVTIADVRLRKADPYLVKFVMGFWHPKKKTLGIEFSGIVEAVGKDVKNYKVNDEVFGSAGFSFGTYAEYICLPEDGVIGLKPENISFQLAAAVTFGGLTALHFLRLGQTGKGKKILIYGASGNCGTAAVQLAKYFGAEVTGLCSTNNVKLVKSIGADKIVDYTKDDIGNYPNSFDIVFDTVGKSPFGKSVTALKEKGYYLRLVHMNPSVVLAGFFTGLTKGKKVIGGTAKERKEDLEFLRGLLISGDFIPVIDREFPLEKISEAHTYAETGRKKGSVVINVAQAGK
ncbi:MAG: NAD(P)-dependent alcohol dehydrogenase [Ignavibacteriales bacterium]|nr:NAD(P)-dependent alcohol dehydrogenase [Ignavibacteriales bacterium]